MTKKRFTMKGSTILECGEEITAWDCCDLLNELHEENKKLRMSPRVESIELEALICENQQLQQENEQLKGEVAHYKLILMSLEQEAKRISKIR